MATPSTDSPDEPADNRPVGSADSAAAVGSEEGGKTEPEHGLNLGAHAPPVPVRKSRQGRNLTAPPFPLPSGEPEAGPAATPADVPAVPDVDGAGEAAVAPAAESGAVAPAAAASPEEVDDEVPVAESPRRAPWLLFLLFLCVAAAYFYVEHGGSGDAPPDDEAAQPEPGARGKAATGATDEPAPIDPAKLAAGREDMFLASIESLAQPALSNAAPSGAGASSSKSKGKAPQGVVVQPTVPATEVEGEVGAASPAFVAWARSVRIGGVRLGAAPRVVIGGGIFAPGQTVDATSGAVFVRIDESKRQVRFREPSGVELAVRY